ncbi:MAG: NADH dehydrogenase (quinone) subunit D [Candidatus Eiseniibacteriota bacterium]
MQSAQTTHAAQSTELDARLPAGATVTREIDDGARQIVNFGPSHPATHGTFRIECLIEGERIIESRTGVGYLHRCFEKMCETHDYWGSIPYTDRLNYCSSFLNGVGFARTVEKLLGCEVPERALSIRVILSELSRIMDHFVCIGANLVDLGAITNFWYAFRPREEIYGLLEACCGARLTVSYCRIGGLARDVPDDFVEHCRRIVRKDIARALLEIEKLNTKNRIFQDRAMGIGVLSREQAIEWGWTGPCGRASGVDYDVRKAHPYDGYDRFDWEMPVETAGDVYARYLVRMEEIRQSCRIIEQALDQLPGGPVIVDDWKIALPPKNEVYTNIEALMAHFKLIMHGIQPPVGEVYSCVEGANGELGFYMVSDGTRKPWRVKVRPPCFAIFNAFDEMLRGANIADVVSILGSLNIIAGELDR